MPPNFIQTVRGSNVKALLGESNSSLPITLDQLYEETNPEQGFRSFHHISLPIQPYLNGDTFYVTVMGGGGYGDPLERDPESVIRDLRQNMTQDWAARNIYKVAYDPQTLRLDEEKTKELRDQARAERKQRGKPFAEFEAEWRKLDPPGAILKYYGSYPDPSPA